MSADWRFMTSDSGWDQLVVCFIEGCTGLSSALDITWKLVPQLVPHGLQAMHQAL